jgi:hypothetical protein
MEEQEWVFPVRTIMAKVVVAPSSWGEDVGCCLDPFNDYVD